MRREVRSVEELRAIVAEPDQYVANKVKDRLSAVQRQWLAHSPLCFVATTDARGRVDVSPKGDPAGFVHVIDDTTIAIPDRRGNKRVDGTGRILADADYFDALAVQGKRPSYDWSQEQLDEYYSEANYRKALY